MKKNSAIARVTSAAKPAPPAKAMLHLKLVAVGHGDALVLHWQPQQGKPTTILIDGGPKGVAPQIATALRDAGATKIDLAILTHSDSDHLDGLIDYARLPDRLPITLYWGPCAAAFRRHGWLFPPRINRGLDALEAFHKSIAQNTSIVFPVEGAQWTSPDRDLVVRVLSPAGRLIERLLVGADSDDLFLRYPTPLGWLLDLAPPPDPEDDVTRFMRLQGLAGRKKARRLGRRAHRRWVMGPDRMIDLAPQA